MLSMTGFGRGEYKEDGVELIVEIKTVNNRYLDVAVKSPRVFNVCDDEIRSSVREMMTRGHADVFITLCDKREKEKSLRLDEGAARAYVQAAKTVSALFPEVENDLTVTGVLRFPDVIKSDEITSLDDELTKALNAALETALKNLNAMRKKEGEKLAADMLSRMDEIERLVSKIEKRAPQVAENYRVKLGEKLKKILDGVEVDEARLLSEVAIFTDRCNIDEELTRLGSHVSQFREICREGVVGRKLDFLVQEFNREANTICSKSNDVEVTRLGLALKNEIEKIREQVQNVE